MSFGGLPQKGTYGGKDSFAVLIYKRNSWADQEILLCNLLLVKCSQVLIEYLTKKFSLCNTDDKTQLEM